MPSGIWPQRRTRPWSALAIACMMCAPSQVWAAEGPPAAAPIRHMVFDVGVTATSRLEIKRSGIGVAGGNADQYAGGLQSKGRVIADVIAATAQSGLVIDISEDAQTRKSPVVRVAVLPNGALSYDPKAEITDEEAWLLRFLARGLIDKNLAPGATFELRNDGAVVKELTSFHVTGVDDKGRLKLDVDATVKAGGAQGYDGTTHGRIVYDAAKTIPVSIVLATRTHQESISRLNTVDLQIDFDLAEDSFGAAK